jgi:hypothetical protein
LVVEAAAARLTLGRTVIVVWTGTPSTRRDGDGGHNLDFVTPQMHCHRRIDGGTNYACGGV